MNALGRGQAGYEHARRATMWNARTPERYPDMIVTAQSESEVVAAVRLARARGMRIGVRSGGHSWPGNHVRDGGMLLDISGLAEISLDPQRMTATVGPGARANELLGMLFERGLFFPAGHCKGVGVGGYLLQGGFGWNGRVHGPACQSVRAVDVVTAAGELVRADAEQNPDLLWAARGAGPGFFGVVTRFELDVHPAPAACANGVYTYPAECLEDVYRWAHDIGPRVPRTMELMVLIHRDEAGEIEIAVIAPVLAASEEEARQALALVESCPVRDRAKLAIPYVPVSIEDLYAGITTGYPENHRWVADNMWTHAGVEELLPGLRRIAETMPEHPSHMLWMNWGESPQRPDMAFSMEDETYIAVYGGSTNPAQDQATADWATSRMREMEQLASGIQLADENLGRRPARFLSDENLLRLDLVRAAYDPDGVFHPWMGRPWEPRV
jgi:FAD/FMN-containing dehydrogenase